MSKDLSLSAVTGEAGQVREDQFAEAGDRQPLPQPPSRNGLRAQYGNKVGLTSGVQRREYRWEESSADDGRKRVPTTRARPTRSRATPPPRYLPRAGDLVANAAAVFSEFNGNFEDGNFLEASIGAAYRPIDNDRLNFLVRATSLYDLPTRTQADTAEETGGGVASYRQRSSGR